MLTSMQKHDFLQLKALLMDAIDFSIDNQSNISDLEESMSTSFDSIIERLQDIEIELYERLSSLENRIGYLIDSYEATLNPSSCEDDEELPF